MSFIETLVILLVAVIVFGPKRLPEVARKVGKVTGALRRAGDEFRRQLMTMDQAVETRVSAVTRDLDALTPDGDDEVSSFARAAGYDPSLPPARAPFVPDGTIAGNGGPAVPLAVPEPSDGGALPETGTPAEAPAETPSAAAAPAPAPEAAAEMPSADAPAVREKEVSRG